MKAEFYDVKLRKSISADVTEKVVYGKEGQKRFALKAKTADGRNLTRFASKEVWEKTQV